MTANGSRRWFGYTADNGDNFAVELDESTYESPNIAFPGVAVGAIPIKATSKRPLSMRRLSCSRVVNDETLRADFYIGTRAIFDTAVSLAAVTVNGDSWNIQTAIGERREFVPATDTAQLDGDVDNNLVAGP